MPASAPNPCRPSRRQELDEVFARARAAPRDHRDLRSGPRRPPDPGRRVGGRQSLVVPPAGGDGHRGVRPRRLRQPHEQADEDPRRPSRRCAVPRWASSRRTREGARQVRQAGRRHRLRRSDDEPRPRPPATRSMRSRRATSWCSRRTRARSTTFETVRLMREALEAGCSRRHPAVHHAAESRGLAGDHAPLRPRHRHRRTGAGPRGLQLGNAGVAARATRPSSSTRPPIFPRRPATACCRRRRTSARAARRMATSWCRRPIPRDGRGAPGRGRVSRDVRGARGAPGGDVGRRGAPPADTSRLASAAREGRWIRHPVRPQVHPGRGRRDRRRQAVLRRSSRR